MTGVAAVKGTIADPIGGGYGVIGVSNSPDGAGFGAANTNGGPDLILDGSADGTVDTLLRESGFDRRSDSTETFALWNSGAGVLDISFDGVLFGNGSGLVGVDAAALGGMPPTEFVLGIDLATSGGSSIHWDNLTDLPPGLDDGDDDTLAGLGCATDEIAVWTGSSWECRRVSSAAYARTYVVGPVGTPEQNGNELLVAIAAIPVPASETDAWLLKIEAGTYDFAANGPFEMKPFVDVEGSGEGVSNLVGELCAFTVGTATTGLVIGAEGAELRNLTVENKCATSGQRSVAIFNEADAFRLNRVTARSTGVAGENRAIENKGSDVELYRVTAAASNGDNNAGLIERGTNMQVTQSSFTGSDGRFVVGLTCDGTDLNLTNVTAEAINGTNDNYGIYVGCDTLMANVTATASGGGTPEGIKIRGSSAQIFGGHFDAVEAVKIEYGSGSDQTVVLHQVTVNSVGVGIVTEDIGMVGTLDIFVNNSSIRGVTNSLDLDGSTAAFIGGSQLAGGPVSGAGTITCAGVWDEAYIYSASSCP